MAAIAGFNRELIVDNTHEGSPQHALAARTGGQKPKLTPRHARIAREMYEELDATGKRKYTVEQIADEFGVTRPTIYRHLGRLAATAAG